jgi:predicted transcriptional regulator
MGKQYNSVEVAEFCLNHPELTKGEMARNFGMNVSTLYDYLKMENINVKKIGRSRKKYSEEELKKQNQYIAEHFGKKSVAQIAKNLGISRHTVYYRLDETVELDYVADDDDNEIEDIGNEEWEKIKQRLKNYDIVTQRDLQNWDGRLCWHIPVNKETKKRFGEFLFDPQNMYLKEKPCL